MDFRLLAYGGTIFAEQRRFGSWSVPEGVLADFYGLSGQDVSFGLGIQGGEVALIFRQRQNLANRGGYPYTLLLDPGATVWTRFGWSAADLLTALQSHDNGRALLSRADGVKREDIERLMDMLALGSAHRSSQFDAPASLMEILAGSLLQGEPLAVSSAQLGYGVRPDAIMITKALDIGEDLPVFSRTGLGWLVGGSLGHSIPFGVQIILDDELPSPDEKVAACREAGHRVIAEWRCVHSRYPEQLDELHTVPPWLWKMKCEDVFDRVALTSALLSLKIDDARYADVRRLAREGGLLAAEIRELACSGAHQRSQIGEQFALFLLDECWAGRLNLQPDVLACCDQGWLEEELLRRGTPPDSFPAGMQLDLAFRERLWLHMIGQADRNQRLSLLSAAVKHLKDLDDYQRLIDAAVPEDLNRTELNSLEPLSKGPLKKALKTRLGPAQRRRAKRGEVEPSLYMRFVEDDGLRQLYEDLKDQYDPRVTAAKLIYWCLEHLNLQEAERQLDLVATSPFRELIPPHVKRDIAEKTGELGNYNGAWGPYRALCDLYDGAQIDPPNIDNAEQRRLQRDLNDLVKDRRSAPNALILERWLGLPREISEPLEIAWSRNQMTRRVEMLDKGMVTGKRDLRASGEGRVAIFERDIKRSLFECGGLDDGIRIVYGAEADGEIRDALTTVVRSATDEEGARFAATFGEASIVVALLRILDEDRSTVIKWLANAGKLLGGFGASVNAMISGAVTPANEEIIWAVIDYLQSDSKELETWAITLRGKNHASEFVKAVRSLNREESRQ